MINFKYNCIILVLVSSAVICSSKALLPGVSHTCRNPEGRLGRCTSTTDCYNHKDCNRAASIHECVNGLGKPPYICCIFGNSIVFPDDGPVTVVLEDDAIRSRSVAGGLRHQSILFPDENGNFNIPSRDQHIDRVGEADKIRVQKSSPVDKFPKPPTCGPMTVGDKIHGGDEAALGEFAWLVNLEYRTEDDDVVIACAGNIINKRYIVTAGHCVKGPIEEKFGELVSLRVGDHNLETTEDCDEQGCNDAYQRFNVIKTIVHEGFEIFPKGRMINDIALVKTDRDMVYSDSVAPICLPDVMTPIRAITSGSRLTVAGWGADGVRNNTDEKRIVDVPYVENSDCSLYVENEQICAGGLSGKDSCGGDSGGSLARLSGKSWLLEGIVSYGRKCGKNRPAVYTRVQSYLQWIRQHVDDDSSSSRAEHMFVNQVMAIALSIIFIIFV